MAEAFQGHHSSKWYHNHPEVPRPARQQEPLVHKSSLLLGFLRLLGIGLILGGLALMEIFFWTGAIVVWAGLAAVLWEVCGDPGLISRPEWIQIVLIGACLFFFDWFTIGVVLIRAPLNIETYAMKNGNYSDGASIGGIIWNSHFTALNVAVVNPEGDDYKDTDIAIMPDKWTYSAVIKGDNPNCTLSAIGGNTLAFTTSKGGARKMTGHKVGHKFEAEDEVGDVFTTLATEGGYRLLCGRLPRHYTVQIVFALVNVEPNFKLHKVKPGEWGMSYSEWSGVKSNVDLLGPRPEPSQLSIEGTYSKDMKRFSVHRVLTVGNGN